MMINIITYIINFINLNKKNNIENYTEILTAFFPRMSVNVFLSSFISIKPPFFERVV